MNVTSVGSMANCYDFSELFTSDCYVLSSTKYRREKVNFVADYALIRFGWSIIESDQFQRPSF